MKWTRVNWFCFLLVLVCGIGQGFTANPTVDANLNNVGTIAADATGTHDLMVNRNNKILKILKSGDFIIDQGDPNTRRTINTSVSNPTKPKHLVADIDIPGQGDLLYRVTGAYIGGVGGTEVKWTADYDKGGPRYYTRVNMDGSWNDYIAMGTNGATFTIWMLGARPNKSYVVSMVDYSASCTPPKNGRVGFSSNSVTLTKASPIAEVSLTGQTVGTVCIKTECDLNGNGEIASYYSAEKEQKYAYAEVTGLATVTYSPASLIGVWLPENCANSKPDMTASTTVTPAPTSWTWSGMPELSYGGNPFAWGDGFFPNPVVGSDYSGQVKSSSNGPLACGYWAAKFRKQVTAVVKTGPTQVVCGNSYTLGMQSNYTDVTIAATIGETVLASWARKLSGERHESISTMNQHQVGATLTTKAEGNWGVVKIGAEAEANYSYTTAHKTEIATKTGYSTTGTDARTVLNTSTIPLAPGKRVWIKVHVIMARKTGIFERYIDSNGDGAAESFNDQDEWEASKFVCTDNRTFMGDVLPQ